MLFRPEEKRRYQRVRFCAPVRFSVKVEPLYGGSLSCDLSEGGLRMHFADFIPKGTEIGLEVPLNTSSVLECRGKVAWVEKAAQMDRYQVGVEFIETSSSAEGQNRLKNFLSQQR